MKTELKAEAIDVADSVDNSSADDEKIPSTVKVGKVESGEGEADGGGGGDDVVMKCSEEVMMINSEVFPVRSVQTQHGDYRTVDEENIVLLRITRSPVPTDEEPQDYIWFAKKPFEYDDEVCRFYIIYIVFF